MVLLHFEGSREYLEGSDLLLTLEAGVEALLTTYSTGTAADAPKDPVIFLAKFLKENNPRASAQGAQRMTEMRAAAATAAVRRRKLEAIFLACDDDGSGALSLNEFEQLFGRVDDSTRSQFGAILFAQADASKDGVLSLHEFVSFYYAKFVALDDEVFERVTDQLLELAKAAVVIDEEAAILDPASAAAEAAATTVVLPISPPRQCRVRAFVSHAAWAPKRPFIVMATGGSAHPRGLDDVGAAQRGRQQFVRSTSAPRPTNVSQIKAQWGAPYNLKLCDTAHQVWQNTCKHTGGRNVSG